jgi:hypothetical protein
MGIVINQVATDGHAGAIWVFFLRPMIDNNVGICDSLVFWDVTNVCV